VLSSGGSSYWKGAGGSASRRPWAAPTSDVILGVPPATINETSGPPFQPLPLQLLAGIAENLTEILFLGRQVFAETLHHLSKLAVQAPPTADTLRRAAEALRLGAGVEEAHIIYVPAEEFCWASDPPPNEKPIGDNGIRHVQRRLTTFGVPLAFSVGAEGRIVGLGPARKVQGQPWVALPVPGCGNFSDMLLVRGAWSGPVPNRLLRLLEASLPSLTALVGRFLDASQASRQRQQLNALSEVARAITQTRDMETVLTRLATVIASVTAYEVVVLDVLAEDPHRLRFRCLNQSRWSDSPQSRTWREWGLTRELELRYLEVAHSRRPALLPDAQHDERVPPEYQEFFRRALLVSSAILPLSFQDEVLGFLSVTSPRPCDFPPQEVQLLEGLAAQAAAAIKAIQNYEALEASREQLRDYAERLRESEEVQRLLARTDALTGIPNRRYVEEFLAAECARSHRDGSPLSVILVDVDDFKRINDAYGHHSGDRVLVQLGYLARSTCRTMDLVGRYGGDEFIFVLPLAELEHAAGFAQRFRSRVARKRLRLATGATARVTVSLGAAAFNSERANPDALLQAADEALYRAKALGKDQVCVAEERAPAA
jgi:diguanylate cyclase (GGDEF)-like protein